MNARQGNAGKDNAGMRSRNFRLVLLLTLLALTFYGGFFLLMASR